MTPRTRPRRRHPANGTRAAALALSLATTGGLAYAFAAADGTPGDEPATVSAAIPDTANPGTPTAGTPTPDTASVTPSSSAPSTAAMPQAQPAAERSSGGLSESSESPAEASYVGDVVSTRWGPVQVEATLVDGQLVEVAAVQMPDGDRRTVGISQSAEPQLRSAALETQSAEVDTVSGATYTSRAYADSLQSALDQAAGDGVEIGLQ